MTTETVVRITDDTPRADIAEAITHLNMEAMRISRKGHVGTASVAYAKQHRRIDALLTDWERATDGQALRPSPPH